MTTEKIPNGFFWTWESFWVWEWVWLVFWWDAEGTILRICRAGKQLSPIQHPKRESRDPLGSLLSSFNYLTRRGGRFP